MTTAEPATPHPVRLIAVPLVVDEARRVLLCRMAPDRGVFPGQWALPGGGVEPGERIDEALRREVREELGVELASYRPLLFKDARLDKRFPDGSSRSLHMVFLVYECTLADPAITLNEEFSEAGWFSLGELSTLELNELTRDTLARAGFLAHPSSKQSIAHVALVVRDYDEAIAFFAQKLRFTLVEDIYQPEQDKRWVVMAPPGSTGTTLLLARASKPEQEPFVGNQAGGRVFLFLSTDDFRRDYDRMLSDGIQFVRPPSEQPYGTVAVFEDLYGNLWDLVQYAGTPPQPRV